MSRLMRAHTQNAQQREQETRGAGGGRKKQWETDVRSVDGRGMGRDTQDRQDGHYMDFQEGKQGI